MRVLHHQYMSHFFILLSLLVSLTIVVPPHPTTGLSPSPTIQQHFIAQLSNPSRRVLHQPFFPESTTPPPASDPPPPPPPPASPDQPFFHELPDESTQPPPPPPPAGNGTAATATQIAAPPAKPVKKVAIAISVGIVTLGMMSALAFYIYKHKVKTHGESQKLVGENSRRTQEDPSTAPPPPSTFLYIGTVEPPNRTSVGDENGVENGSPYRKLKSVKRSDRYRPSPDLQPLPPLPKPPLPTLNSPPPMSSSSDEESQETAFYTPQGSSVVSNDEGSFASGSRMSYKGNNANNIGVPHSKRTSPKSRLLLSSPPTPPPPPPSLPLTQINYSPPISTFSPKRPKFAPPPPPPNMARLQAITTHALQTSKIPPPPPPPPPNMGRLQAITTQVEQTPKIPRAPPPPPRPPVQPQLPRKLGGLETSVPFIPLQELKESQSRISNSRGNYGVEKTRSVEEVSNSKGVSSSERGDGDDADESRPKLKPLHWDKVRASPGRGTVWDQLKSSSFQ